MSFGPAQRRELLAVARDAIDSALANDAPAPCPRDRYSPELLQHQSSFVTLHIGRELRGCCGTIDAPNPLVEDVWRNACASAFRDPRFPPLARDEWPHAHLHISVLDTAVPLPVASEADLLRQLRPGVDGVILEHGAARATFLPSVWEQLPDPARFIRQLKIKAGWHREFWSPQLRVLRYTTESFGE